MKQDWDNIIFLFTRLLSVVVWSWYFCQADSRRLLGTAAPLSWVLCPFVSLEIAKWISGVQYISDGNPLIQLYTGKLMLDVESRLVIYRIDVKVFFSAVCLLAPDTLTRIRIILVIYQVNSSAGTLFFYLHLFNPNSDPTPTLLKLLQRHFPCLLLLLTKCYNRYFTKSTLKLCTEKKNMFW